MRIATKNSYSITAFIGEINAGGINVGGELRLLGCCASCYGTVQTPKYCEKMKL